MTVEDAIFFLDDMFWEMTNVNEFWREAIGVASEELRSLSKENKELKAKLREAESIGMECAV